MNIARASTLALSVLFCLLTVSCTGGKPEMPLGIQNTKLSACPTSPNCVSSDAADPEHYIEPFRLAATPTEVWRITKTLLAAMPRTAIKTADSDYLHAECRSAVFGFVDDFELHLRPEEKLIAVRSAARLGYADFGVNRKRVEALRRELAERKLIE